MKLFFVQRKHVWAQALWVDANMVRVFPTSTNANEHIHLTLGSDHMGRDYSLRFIRVKPRETANAVQHAVSLFFDVG